MKFLLFTILFSFPTLAFDVCKLPKGTQNRIAASLMNTFLSTNRHAIEGWKDECNFVNQFTDIMDYIYYDDTMGSLSEASKFFSNFPSLKYITIGTKSSYIPETIFNNIKSLKEVEIYGDNIKTLPTHLFSHNRKLKILKVSGRSFTGITDSLFFKYIPRLEILDVYSHAPSGHPTPWTAPQQRVNLPDDLCKRTKKLGYLWVGIYDGNKIPSSCCYQKKIEEFLETGSLPHPSAESAVLYCKTPQ